MNKDQCLECQLVGQHRSDCGLRGRPRTSEAAHSCGGRDGVSQDECPACIAHFAKQKEQRARDDAAKHLDEPEDMARIRTMALIALGLEGSPRPTVLLVRELAERGSEAARPDWRTSSSSDEVPADRLEAIAESGDNGSLNEHESMARELMLRRMRGGPAEAPLPEGFKWVTSGGYAVCDRCCEADHEKCRGRICRCDCEESADRRERASAEDDECVQASSPWPPPELNDAEKADMARLRELIASKHKTSEAAEPAPGTLGRSQDVVSDSRRAEAPKSPAATPNAGMAALCEAAREYRLTGKVTPSSRPTQVDQLRAIAEWARAKGDCGLSVVLADGVVAHLSLDVPDPYATPKGGEA